MEGDEKGGRERSPHPDLSPAGKGFKAEYF